MCVERITQVSCGQESGNRTKKPEPHYRSRSDLFVDLCSIFIGFLAVGIFGRLIVNYLASLFINVGNFLENYTRFPLLYVCLEVLASSLGPHRTNSVYNTKILLRPEIKHVLRRKSKRIFSNYSLMTCRCTRCLRLRKQPVSKLSVYRIKHNTASRYQTNRTLHRTSRKTQLTETWSACNTRRCIINLHRASLCANVICDALCLASHVTCHSHPLTL